MFSGRLVLMTMVCAFSLGNVMGLRSACAAETVDLHGDWVVQGDETRRGEQIRLDGNLVLPAGAVLTLEDCTLEILGSYSREHLVDWKGGTLITRRCTIGGHVREDGVPVHTVFHLYEGQWQAEDTTVQYSYGISFHWDKGRGVLRGTRLKAGPRPDAIILSGEADVRLVESDFPIGLGIYVDQGGKTQLNLATNTPITANYDATTLTPGVKWRLELVKTNVERWFVFIRNIGMEHPPCEIALGESNDVIVSLLGHNLTGDLVLSNDLQTPLRVGNVTLKNTGQPARIAMWAVYLSGEKTDLSIAGTSHICELMHRAGRLKISGIPARRT